MRNSKGQFTIGHKEKVTHGMRHHRAYNTWNHMMSRCYRPNDSRWKWYGARGISVCKKWHKFEGFWEDMKESYFATAIIDRIDPNGNYKKNNCRWVTVQESLDNKRTTLKIRYNGEDKTLSQWCKELSLKYHKTYLRLFRYHYQVEEAFTN